MSLILGGSHEGCQCTLLYLPPNPLHQRPIAWANLCPCPFGSFFFFYEVQVGGLEQPQHSNQTILLLYKLPFLVYNGPIDIQ